LITKLILVEWSMWSVKELQRNFFKSSFR
jgi:hypothetical protein